jgi:hypothetical protein
MTKKVQICSASRQCSLNQRAKGHFTPKINACVTLIWRSKVLMQSRLVE